MNKKSFLLSFSVCLYTPLLQAGLLCFGLLDNQTDYNIQLRGIVSGTKFSKSVLQVEPHSKAYAGECPIGQKKIFSKELSLLRNEEKVLLSNFLYGYDEIGDDWVLYTNDSLGETRLSKSIIYEPHHAEFDHCYITSSPTGDIIAYLKASVTQEQNGYKVTFSCLDQLEIEQIIHPLSLE